MISVQESFLHWALSAKVSARINVSQSGKKHVPRSGMSPSWKEIRGWPLTAANRKFSSIAVRRFLEAIAAIKIEETFYVQAHQTAANSGRIKRSGQVDGKWLGAGLD
jgi:hypothetical protein